MEKNFNKVDFEGINFVPSKKFVMPKKVEPGMFYYADGLIFPELIKGNQVSAIVGWMKNNQGLAMGLRETELPWSSKRLMVDIARGLSGWEATEAILKAAREQGKKAEAAEWCAEYAFDGIEGGTMFMPNDKELQNIFANYQKLKEPFSLLKLKGLREDKYYWSSSEISSSSYAWVVNPSDGYMIYDYKYYTNQVRCVLAFTI